MRGTTEKNIGNRLTGIRQLAVLLISSCLLQACGDGTESAHANDALAESDDAIAQDKSSADRLRRIRNKAPSITGTPLAQVLSGQAYNFTPSASDPNGDRLTFKIANKPTWASFNAATGALTGTPTVTATTVAADVTISVSDGRSTTTLPPFDIEVVAPAPVLANNESPAPALPANNRATVQWNAPTTNSDGSTLTDLAGFKLYYGRTGGMLDQMVQISSPNTTQQIVENLASGTWYFAVSAVNAAGIESQLSALATRSFP